jgi:hypothetical protein
VLQPILRSINAIDTEALMCFSSHQATSLMLTERHHELPTSSHQVCFSLLEGQAATATAIDIDAFCNTALGSASIAQTSTASLLPSIVVAILTLTATLQQQSQAQAQQHEIESIRQLLSMGYRIPIELLEEELAIDARGMDLELSNSSARPIASRDKAMHLSRCLWHVHMLHVALLELCSRFDLHNDAFELLDTIRYRVHILLRTKRLLDWLAATCTHNSTRSAHDTTAAATCSAVALPAPNLSAHLLVYCFSLVDCLCITLESLCELLSGLLTLVRNTLASIDCANTVISSSSTSSTSSSSSSSSCSTPISNELHYSASVIEWMISNNTVLPLLTQWIASFLERSASASRFVPCKPTTCKSSQARAASTNAASSPNTKATSASDSETKESLLHVLLLLYSVVLELLKNTQHSSVLRSDLIQALACGLPTLEHNTSNTDQQRLLQWFDKQISQSNDMISTCLLLHIVSMLSLQDRKSMATRYQMALAKVYTIPLAHLVGGAGLGVSRFESGSILETVVASLPPIPLLDSLSKRCFWSANVSSVPSNCMSYGSNCFD